MGDGGVMTKEERKKAKREHPERWHAQEKTEVVMRLLRGEDLREVRRERPYPQGSCLPGDSA